MNDVIFACVSEAIKRAEDNQTVGEIRLQCKQKDKSLMSDKRIFEKQVSSNPFAILPYRPNYILPYTLSNASDAPYDSLLQGREFDDVELVFQISVKYAAIEDMLVKDLDLELAFTTISWWQAYNGALSSPFRETNYEPELMLSYYKPWTVFGLKIDQSFLSLSHQSNGRGGSLSRSWNRIVGGVKFATGDFIWGLKTWWRFDEGSKKFENDPAGDDNPDIIEFMGHGELDLRWNVDKNHNIDLMLRNSFHRNNKGAIKLGWTYSFNKQLHGYVEYFNGYGESLIYYNQDVSRIGVGVKFTDWL